MKLLASALLFAGMALAQFPNGYTYRVELDIPTPAIASDQSNFTAVVCFGAAGTNCAATDLNLATVANGGHLQNSSGFDLIFTSDIAGSTVLKWNSATSYNPVTGDAIYWIKIPTVSHTAPSVIYMWYGKSGVSTFQGGTAGAAYDANFLDVLQMEDNAASTTVLDSTSNGNNFTNQANTSGKSVAGFFGKALTYNGSTDYSSRANPLPATTYTVSAWVNLPSIGTANGVMSTGNSISDNAATWELQEVSGSAVAGYAGTHGYSGFYNPTVGQWFHIAIAGDGTTQYLYANGTLVGSAAGAALNNNNFYIGTGFSALAAEIVDEVHASNVTRSADWIKLEWLNQGNVAAFWTVGPETTATPSVACPDPAAMRSFPYASTAVGSGGTPAYTWALASGSLPHLVTLNTSTGLLSGTPDTAATSSFTLTVTDTNSNTSPPQSCQIVVQPTAADAPRIVSGVNNTIDFSGPTNVLLGYQSEWGMVPRWSFPVYPNVGSQVWDTEGTFTPTNGMKVLVQSTGSLPAGYYNQYGTDDRATWLVCNVSGNTFKLQPGAYLGTPVSGCDTDKSSTVTVSGLTVTRTGGDRFIQNWQGNSVVFGGRVVVIGGVSCVVNTVTLDSSPSHADVITVLTPPGNGSGITLTFAQSPAFTDKGTGIIYVTEDNYGYPSGKQIWYTATSGYTGAIQWADVETAAVGYQFYQTVPFQQTYSQQTLKLTPSALGAQTITITVAADNIGTNPTTFTLPISVTALSPLSTSVEPGSYPAITGLSTWETNMVSGTFGTLGGGFGTYCDPSTGNLWLSLLPGNSPPNVMTTYGDANEQNGTWYYQAGWIYSRIAGYTGNAGWNKCGTGNMESQYVRDTQFLIGVDNETRNGVEIYTHGQLLSGAANDQRYLTGTQYQFNWYLLGSRFRPSLPTSISWWCGQDGPIWTGTGGSSIREWALWIDGGVDLVKAGQPVDSCLQAEAHVLINALQNIFDATYSPGDQIWIIDGFCVPALWHYWQITHDPLVPYIIQRAADYLASFYSLTTHSAPYNTSPPGAGCSCPGRLCPPNTAWIVRDVSQPCNDTYDNTVQAITALNNLNAITMALAWRWTGTTSYQTIGDDAFAHVFDGGGWVSTGKLVDQVYLYSFDYVCLRKGTCAP